MRKIYLGFGIDLAQYNGDSSWELPLPGTFVIGRDMTIRFSFVDADYTRRLEPAAILDSLRALHDDGGNP